MLSSHLPPATQTPTLIDMLDHAPEAPEFGAPDQAMLEAILSGIPAQAIASQPVVDLTQERQPAG